MLNNILEVKVCVCKPNKVFRFPGLKKSRGGIFSFKSLT